MQDAVTKNHNILRRIAIMTSIVAAIISLFLMFETGRNQKSILLIGLFTVWVLSPFIGPFVATKVYNPRIINSTRFYLLIIILAVGSLVAYSGALTPPGTKAAFIFLVTPFISWVIILIVYLIGNRNVIHSG